MTFKSTLSRLLLFALCMGLMSAWLAAQTTTTGDITGLVTDPSGAVLPGATVSLRSLSTGTTSTATTGSNGTYRFSLLLPGQYSVSVTAKGFQTSTMTVPVRVGQATTANLSLKVGAATQTVTVTGEAVAVQRENGNITTTFTPEQVANLPDPGNDLTGIVQTSPGTVMNTQAGYGNFSTFGLPATSNLFTVNGMDNNDPFLSLNNSGATNLLLGKNDVQEVTVVNNGYAGQYGGLAGANVNYVSKSGSNDWHGNAIYYWNGRTLNANNFFNNASGVKKPFDNANQWAWSVGGPIVKDKTFFFFNQEGLRVVLPTNLNTKIPSPQFQSATLANLSATGQGAQVPFYTNIFNLYNAAPGNHPLSSVSGGGCGTFTGLGAGVPCALQFQSTAGNFTHEWTLNARVDQVFSPTSRVFFQFTTDHGVQATFTDPINSAFNLASNQPQYQGQLNWTKSIGANAVNQLVASASWYSAIFGQNAPQAAATVFPAELRFSGRLFNDLGGINRDFPQGRKVTQYQLVDDYSYTMGNHNLKFGANWKQNYVNDFDFGFFNIPFIQTSLSNFFNGVVDSSQQAFTRSLNQPFRLYTLGIYGQDEWRVNKDLRLTLSLRVNHNSNPLCTHNCISRLVLPFTSLPHDAAVPYNQIIQSGLRQSFGAYTHYNIEPRFGFAWAPLGLKNTVLRGGFGIFVDAPPATIVDSFAQNVPGYNTFIVSGPLAPTAPGNVFASAAAANAAFLSGFSSGGTVASISAANPAFVPPNFTTADLVLRTPRFQEWNLELQQQVTPNMVLSANYVGNHGVHEPIQNNALNAFFPGFTGLPATAPDPRFGTITQIQTSGVSNYNGLTLSLISRIGTTLQIQTNYTWSHALDEVSNGGFLQFNFNTNTSILNPQNPFNLKANYGNADYDIRHYFSMNYNWEVPFRNYFHWGPEQLWRGWNVSGAIFWRSGTPFTVIDGLASSTLSANNYGANLFANQIAGNGQNGTCYVDKQCILASAFSPSTATPTTFGNQERNQFRGPRFFDTDLSVVKNTQIPGWEKGQLGLGVQFFNLFNHPNFDQPVQDISSSQFGTVINTVSVPTSILGSFLGGDASPRIIELTAKLTF